ncbi:DUF2336 domain-containing protein [Bosea sp. TAB14]|uniref:DUF2336 domain-containing protein n=1 Tax=Bosea sp. TAB14 TaxID=3237481 RepID=UPI003F8EB3A5
MAPSPHTPRNLALGLIADQSDVAALMLAHSPVFTEADLVDAAAVGDLLAQRAVAIRRCLPAGVAAALAEVGGEEALLTLANNRTAEIPDFSFERMIERCGDNGALREALLERPAPGLAGSLRGARRRQGKISRAGGRQRRGHRPALTAGVAGARAVHGSRGCRVALDAWEITLAAVQRGRPGAVGARRRPEIGDGLRDGLTRAPGREQPDQPMRAAWLQRRRDLGDRRLLRRCVAARRRCRCKLGAGMARRQHAIDLLDAACPAGLVVEDAAIGRGGLGKVARRNAARIARGRPDQIGCAARAQHMGHVELARLRLAPERASELVAVLLGQRTRHDGGNLGVVAQLQDLLAQRRVGDGQPAATVVDGVGVVLQALLRPLLLHHRQPGLLDELKQAGRARGFRLGVRCQRRFPLRRLEQIVEARAGPIRALANGADDRVGGGLGLAARRRGEKEHRRSRARLAARLRGRATRLPPLW